MTKIAIIDMGFHKKTKSSDFFLNIIHQGGDISFFYDDGLNGGKKDNSYRKQNFDIYIYWQIYPTRYDLWCLRGKKVYFVPMYDGMVLRPFVWKWMVFWDVKILAFSTKIRDYFAGLGHETLYTQYFLPPLQGELASSKNIYWRYRGSITRDMVKTIIGSQKIDGLTIKNIPDPGYSKLVLSEDEIQQYNVSFIDTFYPTPADAYKDLMNHRIYIAPRRQEGIGMTVLESLSLGQCVIANNDGTMNEYIIDGKNGLLTDFSREIDLTDYEQIGNNAKQWYQEQYKQWEEKKQKIQLFFSQATAKTVPLWGISLALMWYMALYIARKAFFVFKLKFIFKYFANFF